MFRKLEWKAVGIGFLTYWVLGFGVVIVYFLIHVVNYREAIEADMPTPLDEPGTFEHVTFTIISSVCCVIAGIVTAKFSRHSPRLNAVAIGVITIVISLPLIKWTDPLWYNLNWILTTIPLLLIGVWLALKFSSKLPDHAETQHSS